MQPSSCPLPSDSSATKGSAGSLLSLRGLSLRKTRSSDKKLPWHEIYYHNLTICHWKSRSSQNLDHILENKLWTSSVFFDPAIDNLSNKWNKCWVFKPSVFCWQTKVTLNHIQLDLNCRESPVLTAIHYCCTMLHLLHWMATQWHWYRRSTSHWKLEQYLLSRQPPWHEQLRTIKIAAIACQAT